MKTAVELLIEQISLKEKTNETFLFPTIKNNIFEQAKEIEKQQIIDAVNSQRQLGWDEKGEQYYNEIFKK